MTHRLCVAACHITVCCKFSSVLLFCHFTELSQLMENVIGVRHWITLRALNSLLSLGSMHENGVLKVMGKDGICKHLPLLVYPVIVYACIRCVKFAILIYGTVVSLALSGCLSAMLNLVCYVCWFFVFHCICAVLCGSLLFAWTCNSCRLSTIKI